MTADFYFKITTAIFVGLGCLAYAISSDYWWRPFYKMISRKRREQAKKVFAQRPRARVLRAGDILTLTSGREITTGFILDCRGIIPAYSWGPAGEYLIGGYTPEELLEIARRPSEFVESEE